MKIMDEEEINNDIHICLACHMTFVGLGKYVKHKTEECKCRRVQKRSYVETSNPSICTITSSPLNVNYNIDTSEPTSAGTKAELIDNTTHNESTESVPMAPVRLDVVPCFDTSTSVIFSTLDRSRPLMISPDRRNSIDVFHDYDNRVTEKNNIQSNFQLLENNVISSTDSHQSVAIDCPIKPAVSDNITDNSPLTTSTISATVQSESNSVSVLKAEVFKPKLSDGDKQSSSEIPDAFSVAEFFASLELRIRDPNTSSIKQQNEISAESNQTLHLSEINTSSITHSSSVKLQDVSTVSTSTQNQQHKNDAFEERLKNIKVANILTDMNFSSDSEGLPSDVDELLNFSSDEDDHELRHSGGKWKPGGYVKSGGGSSGKQPPSGHTKGKWRPTGGKLTSYGKHGGKKSSAVSGGINLGKQVPGKWKPGMIPSDQDKNDDNAGSQQKNLNHSSTSTGKWKSGQRVAHGLGKHSKLRAYKMHRQRGLTDSEDEQEKDTQTKEDKETATKKNPSAGKKSDGNEGKVTCDVCNKSFKSHYYLKHHEKTEYHKKCCRQKSRSNLTNAKKKDNENNKSGITAQTQKTVTCVLCNKKVSNKYTYSRHLLTEHQSNNHVVQEALGDSIDKEIHTLLLQQKPYQCRICLFFSENVHEFDKHIVNDLHINKCNTLLGPLYCKRCQFKCSSNDEMIIHIKSDQHCNVMKKSTRPCILMESRTKLKCGRCGKMLTSLTKLTAHIKSVHNKEAKKVKGIVNRPKCEHCGIECRSNALLEIHLRRKHTGEKPFLCKLCEIGFSTMSDLRRHLNTKKHLDSAVEKSMQNGKHEELKVEPTYKKPRMENLKQDELESEPKKGKPDDLKRRKCKYDACEHTEYKIKDLMQHYKKVHPNSHRYDCKLCDYGTDHKSHWDVHCRSKRHTELVEADRKGKEMSGDQSNETSVTLFKCLSCDMIFNNRKSLQKHEFSSHILKAQNSIDQIQKGEAVENLYGEYLDFVKNCKLDVNNQVSCPVSDCGKKLCSQSIVQHLKGHAREKFTCVYCGKSYENGERLKCHLHTHLPNIWHYCSHCTRKFKAKSSLQQHILTTHTEYVNFDVKFTCEECGYRCMKKMLLNSHLKSHHNKDDEKQFRCPWRGCSKAFALKHNLNEHVKIHTNVKNHLCDQCGYSTSFKHYLKRHKKKHTGIRDYKCEYCTYSSFTSSKLRSHMAVHINAKPYVCPYPSSCDFKTNNLGRIRKHVNFNNKHVKRGEYLYPCRHCDHGYKSQLELKEHLINIHDVAVTLEEISVCALHPGIRKETSNLRVVPPGQKVNPIAEKYVPKKWKQAVLKTDTDL